MISAVLDHLWQSTLFAGAVMVLALALRRAPAGVRYGLWFSASAKFLLPFAALAALGRLLTPAIRPPVAARADAAFIAQTVQPFTPPEAAEPAAHAAAPVADAAPPVAHAVLTLDPALILFAAWVLGSAAVLAVWLVRWRQVRAAVRGAAPLALEAPMPVLASPWMREPGLVGLFRPILLVPDTLFEHLKPAEIQALVAHEACHLRRRDNLTGALHMLVEALFWFHPPVWWIGARLIDERERACDEAVVRAGHDPAVYALSLVECSRLYLQSPLSCVAGASGSYLIKRVEMIMSSSPLRPLSRPGKAALLAAGACVLALPVAAGWLTSPGLQKAAARVVAAASRTVAFAPQRAPAAGQSDDAAPPAMAVRDDTPPAPVIAAADVTPAAAPASGRSQPSPGTEDAVRRWIAKVQLHQSDDEDMSPAMAEAARQQQGMVMQTLSAFGPLQGVSFLRLTPDDEDAYEADFAHAKIEVLVGPLTADGKLDRLRWRPIWARDGEPPRPGVPLAPVADVEVSKPALILVNRPEPFEGTLPVVAAAGPPQLGTMRLPLLTDPVWVRRPTLEAIDRVYPPVADRERRPGRASMRCHADDRGYLSRCVVLSESPEGLGFGAAALFLQTEYKLRTLDGTGTPVNGHLVDVSVDFTPRFWAKLAGEGGQVVRWTTDPLTTRYGRARYPWEAMQKGVAAHVTLSCVVQPDGHLADCDVARESPKGLGFGRMALLSKTQVLQVETHALDGTPTPGRRVEVDYVFNPPCNAVADSNQTPCGVGRER